MYTKMSCLLKFRVENTARQGLGQGQGQPCNWWAYGVNLKINTADENREKAAT
jgi:hypothetical protein